MKKLLMLLLVSVLVFGLTACGGDDDPPQVRVTNLHASTQNISYKTEVGNTVNINGVDQGITTEYKLVGAGLINVEGYENYSSGVNELNFTAEVG